jgi:hypothetical protein
MDFWAFAENPASLRNLFRHPVCLNSVMSRTYRLGRRKVAIDRTSERILDAARRLVEAHPSPLLSVGGVAREAGVTRATVYNRFGSRTGLLRALEPATGPAEASTVQQYFAERAVQWASNPALYRHLGSPESMETSRRLAEALAAADDLRPGCSLKEAEDVLGALGSFAMFDRLYRDGRRSSGSVVEILMRLAGTVLA